MGGEQTGYFSIARREEGETDTGAGKKRLRGEEGLFRLIPVLMILISLAAIMNVSTQSDPFPNLVEKTLSHGTF